MARKRNLSDTKGRAHIVELYRQLVSSVREARNMQDIMEKEQQMRRLARYLRGRRPQTA